MSHVLIIALGPVQDFIVAARRCRDFWFGSWLLSELSKAVARGVAGSAELVFPGASLRELDPASSTSVANKIVALVPEGGSPADAAAAGRAALLERLHQIRDRSFVKVAGDFFQEENALAQVEDLIEMQWASAPIESGGYAAAREAAEALLGARKNTRLWGPVTWGSPAPKSSIDGERESVLHENLYDRLRDRPEELRRYGVTGKERLCGVGLMKRNGIRDDPRGKRFGHHFLSTGHLAAWPLLERMESLPPERQVALGAAWQGFLGMLRSLGVVLEDIEVYVEMERPHPVLGRYDGGLVFENRIPDLFEDVLPESRRRESIRAAREALGAFLKALEVATPLPYYAILAADGDRMGKAIEQQTTVTGHQRLSLALDVFAREVGEIVEGKFRGELVYSGGDDVLAFVPLHHALPCAKALAEAFRERLQDFPADDEGATPTLSVGIGISHFLEPMGRALALARRAEGLAKKTRNALAVIVDKRSGPAVETRGLWGTVDEDLTAFVEMHRNDWVPDGAAYELRDLARLLLRPSPDQEQSLKDLVREETRRILNRKQPQHGKDQEIQQEHLERLLKVEEEHGIGALAERLLITRVIAEASLEAKPLTPGEAP
jgi:CRISPR-associated protein Cmr2